MALKIKKQREQLREELAERAAETRGAELTLQELEDERARLERITSKTQQSARFRAALASLGEASRRASACDPTEIEHLEEQLHAAMRRYEAAEQSAYYGSYMHWCHRLSIHLGLAGEVDFQNGIEPLLRRSPAYTTRWDIASAKTVEQNVARQHQDEAAAFDTTRRCTDTLRQELRAVHEEQSALCLEEASQKEEGQQWWQWHIQQLHSQRQNANHCRHLEESVTTLREALEWRRVQRAFEEGQAACWASELTCARSTLAATEGQVSLLCKELARLEHHSAMLAELASISPQERQCIEQVRAGTAQLTKAKLLKQQASEEYQQAWSMQEGVAARKQSSIAELWSLRTELHAADRRAEKLQLRNVQTAELLARREHAQSQLLHKHTELRLSRERSRAGAGPPVPAAPVQQQRPRQSRPL